MCSEAYRRQVIGMNECGLCHDGPLSSELIFFLISETSLFVLVLVQETNLTI
jgi:hypothetical protein